MSQRLLVISESADLPAQIEAACAMADWRFRGARPDSCESLLAIDLPDGVVLVVRSHETWAEAVLARVQAIDEHIPVVVLLTDGEVATAVEFMKAGAYDVLSWPDEAVRLPHTVARALHLAHLTRRVFLLESQVGNGAGKLDQLLGQSAVMQEMFQLVRTVAKSTATVLITGESGTGKELVARALHRYSARAALPFMDLNCGAIPRDLLENELFGHERGAFTGAERQYIGCCEQASGGSLFLDEICEMPPALQVKILRLLQERSFTRVGGTEKVNVDLRFIAATNRDIQKEVAEGRFREDLYYRLHVVPIHIPPLRERSEDVPLLARTFMERCAQKLEKPFVDIAPDAMELLVAYPWPGNVRELENVLERVVVLHNDTRVKEKHLPPQLHKGLRQGERTRGSVAARRTIAPQAILPLDLVEKYAIEAALEKCVGNVSEAARRLKIGQATLYRKIRQYGLRH